MMMMARRAAFALIPMALAFAGCGGGAPAPGDAYMLTKAATCWEAGLGEGDTGVLGAGSVVRVVESGKTKDGKAFLVLAVERPVGAAVVGESAGDIDTDPAFDRPVFVHAGHFRGTPTAAP